MIPVHIQPPAIDPLGMSPSRKKKMQAWLREVSLNEAVQLQREEDQKQKDEEYPHKHPFTVHSLTRSPTPDVLQ